MYSTSINAVNLLKEHLEQRGCHLGNGILKVDSFINHQIDPILMEAIGEEFASRFRNCKVNKILTAETSGIAPALATGVHLKTPVIFARKHKPITMSGDLYTASSISPTHKSSVELLVSPEYLKESDRVLIIDDFLASAATIKALAQIVQQSGATLVGIGAVIEKTYAKGREALAELNVPIESLVAVDLTSEERLVIN